MVRGPGEDTLRKEETIELEMQLRAGIPMNEGGGRCLHWLGKHVFVSHAGIR